MTNLWNFAKQHWVKILLAVFLLFVMRGIWSSFTTFSDTPDSAVASTLGLHWTLVVLVGIIFFAAGGAMLWKGVAHGGKVMLVGGLLLAVPLGLYILRSEGVTLPNLGNNESAEEPYTRAEITLMPGMKEKIKRTERCYDSSKLPAGWSVKVADGGKFLEGKNGGTKKDTVYIWQYAKKGDLTCAATADVIEAQHGFF